MRRYHHRVRTALAAVLALVTVAACGGSSTPTPAPQASAKPTGGTDASTALPLVGPVGLVEATDGTVWAAWAGSDAIAPLGGDGAPGTPVEVGDTPLRIAELDGSLWVTTIRDGMLHPGRPAGRRGTAQRRRRRRASKA